MIVPMKKVSLVILNRDKQVALTALRKAGLVHLEKIEGTGEKLALRKNTSTKLTEAESILSEVKLPKKGFNFVKCSNDEAYKKALRTLEIAELKKTLFEKISNDANEIERLSEWGNVTPKDFEYLSDKEIYLSMYEIPQDKYSLISDDIKTIVVNTVNKVVHFLVVTEEKTTERVLGLPPEAYQVVLPEFSTEEIAKEIEESKIELNKLEKEFKETASYMQAIRSYNKSLQKDIEFESVFSGMQTESDGDVNSLSWLTGYVPENKIDALKKEASLNNWALAYDDPEEDDEVPTQLKNNKLVSLIYPLTDFLGTVPGYKEYDISGWFLFFFTIFFGMIFGDGGYGLLVTLVTLILILKNKAKGKTSPALGLVFLVGLATVAWGFVTCTWFGLTPEQLDNFGLGFLNKITLSVLSNSYKYLPDGTLRTWSLPWTANGIGLTVDHNLQIFCFGLALFQLSVAHVKGFCRNIKEKSLKFIADLGSLGQLWGMFYVVLSMVVSSEIFPLDLVFNEIPIGKIAIYCIGIGFALSFVFANYEGNLISSILESVKNIISVLLGVVNVFSDVVSYIRLWAVGLAGAAISNTVNTMAGPLMGHAIVFVAAVVLLVFGHGLNMILNLLSVIVHGVRLNTLEFSTHLGMSWSGFKYEPFSETVEK